MTSEYTLFPIDCRNAPITNMKPESRNVDPMIRKAGMPTSVICGVGWNGARTTSGKNRKMNAQNQNQDPMQTKQAFSSSRIFAISFLP